MEQLLQLPQELSLDYLLAENRSVRADELRGEWLNAKRNGTLTAAWICSDARAVVVDTLGSSIAEVTSIAAADQPSRFEHVFKHSGVAQVISSGHFKCGGMHVKEVRNGQTLPIRRPVESFIDSRIISPNTITQAYRAARRIAQISGKPVLAAITNHETREIFPIAEIWNGGANVRSNVDERSLLEGTVQYDENNVPILQDRQLSPNFAILMRRNKERVAYLQRQGGFDKKQKVQNPGLILMTTSIIPAGLRYPSKYLPNSIFSIKLGYKKSGNGNIDIDGYEKIEATQQLEYPIGNSLTAKPNEAFSDTHTLLIETPDLKESESLAGELVGHLFVKQWLSQGSQILISEVHSGRIAKIRRLDDTKIYV